ncbi:MAG: glycosyltransferase family 39 protein [Chloroflexi bacterium]|nr:glycosyltransferase family 39 protein [Chloroflexota bacterium]
MSFKNCFWLLVAILVAFALRVYRLDAQSLWNDEGTSIALASLNLDAIINGAARDIHPPLYYYLLSNWLSVIGNSEFAARFLSVIAGVLLAAITLRIAQKLFDEEVGIIAAFLAAFSPLLIYYSQETRMYIWMALWSAVAALALFRISDFRFRISDFPISTRSARPPVSNAHRAIAWLVFVLATIAALYTHYFAVTLVLVENLAFGFWVWLAWQKRSSVVASRLSFTPFRAGVNSAQQSQSEIRNPKSEIVLWLIGQLVIGLAFLPWFLFAGNQLTAWPAISEPFDLPTLLWRGLNIFSVGITLDGALAAILAAAFAFLFLVGVLPRRRDDQERWAIALLLIWTLAPILFMFVVSLSRPAYNPKFLLLALPPFLILVSRGVSQLKTTHYALRTTHYALGILILVFTLFSLSNLYHNPRYARDDYRALLATINITARATDAILIDAPGQADVVRYYNRRALALYPLPRMRPPDAAATRADVDQVLSRGGNVYAIYWATEQSDPQKIIETKLAESAFPAREEWFGNVQLAVYGNAGTTRGELKTIQLRVGEEIILQDYRNDAARANAGDVLTLTLNWRADATPAARYKVFVHLLEANDRIVAQRDAEPVSNLRPTTTWRAGETIADNYGLLIEPGIAPGEYRIEIGMYRADSGERLTMRARDGSLIGDHFVLGAMRIE